ncbi:MAG: DUF4956 domain-containing protein [Planctomycetota bacterium]
MRWPLAGGYLEGPHPRHPIVPDWNSFLAAESPDLKSLLVNLGLVLILGQLLVWHYQRFSPVLSNKRKFSRVFVFVGATTMLVITVVKSSLALSLGLVGALSIIRFRTPIKEPEELAYLFLSIGLGLGLGANQHVVTVLIYTVVLGYMALISSGRGGALPPRLLLHLTGRLPEGGAGRAEAALKELLASAGAGATRVDLRRIDTEGASFNATLVVDLEGAEDVGPLMTRLESVLPGSSISVVEGNALD